MTLSFQLVPAVLVLIVAAPVVDDFSRRRPDLWVEQGGIWSWRDGVVHQSEEGRRRALLRLVPEIGRHFRASVRLRILAGATFRSAGVMFDYTDADNWTGVYLTNVATETERFGPKLQITIRRGGRAEFPPDGRVSLPVVLERWYTLELSVMGSRIEAFVDGQPQLSFELTRSRNRGSVVLYTFDAVAEFDDFRVSSEP